MANRMEDDARQGVTGTTSGRLIIQNKTVDNPRSTGFQPVFFNRRHGLEARATS